MSLSVWLEDAQKKVRRDLSDKVTIECKTGMQMWFTDPELAGKDLSYPRNPWGRSASPYPSYQVWIYDGDFGLRTIGHSIPPIDSSSIRLG